MSSSIVGWLAALDLGMIMLILAALALLAFYLKRLISYRFERATRRIERHLDRLARAASSEVPDGVAAKIYYLGKNAGKNEVAG